MVATTATYAQNSAIITGKVYDEQQKAIELVNIKLVETNQYSITKSDGRFSIVTSGNQEQEITLEFSYIGFKRLTRVVKVSTSKIDLGIITLKILDLSLKEISISAKRDYQGTSNSSFIIDRDMIEQIPALSVNDLLNQIPNRTISPPSLQNVQNLTLRSTFPSTIKSDPFELNNSFGIAIIMDGQAISNNANMQSYNPGISGLSGSHIYSPSSYGLVGGRNRSYSGDYTFGGTDLRQIPADNIESIEVIAGVPSAKYGDLSDGAIIIERQAGKSAGYLRMQVRDNATSYGLSKGFKLGEKSGALNIGVNYVNSYADNREKLKAYRRINTNAMWTNSFGLENQFKNTFSIDYGQNLDGIKFDPDNPKSTKTRFDSWNFGIGNRFNYRLKGNFLKNISLNVKYNEGHQQTYREENVNKSYVAYSDATTTGITEGIFDTGIYNSVYQVDGRPVSLSTRLDFNSEFNTGKLIHYLSFGANYNYSINKGEGQLSDPNKPRSVLGSGSPSSISTGRFGSDRYYDFNLAVAQQDVGAYLEDLFKLKVLNRELNVRAGVRLDVQNGYTSVAPRANINYKINDKLKVGFAYGIGFKSPGLAQRYPGPTFMEIPMVLSYNGNVKESMYLLYVERYDPTNKNLKSSQSQTFELTTQVKISDFNLSVTAFHKDSKNGISTINNLKNITLPVYTATFNPGEKPTLTADGFRKYQLNYYTFSNSLSSTNTGLELMLSTPAIEAIATSFNISGGIFRTNSSTTEAALRPIAAGNNTGPDYPKTGIYEPNNRTSYLSNGRITATTHIPKISLIAQFTADFRLMQKTKNRASAGIPLGYYTNDLEYVSIPNFDVNHPYYNELFVPKSAFQEDDLPRILPNYHLSLSKEIKKRFKFSFNVYNVFNYQPSYTNAGGTFISPNPSPTFGAELSLKL
ncbi:Outer membrane receptor proteins, mostly Fe transport [Pedobacter caeni]|uniref:Outer membrane receptor proteins, mostly Fe transport n=2 Tax=Pedobacter caeni TaxID=288992 RepID=A0A1M5JDL8_9SPHI|nr:Outer membrane receptor proteins, mostly Fe transport [Pedobacter caeni]